MQTAMESSVNKLISKMKKLHVQSAPVATPYAEAEVVVHANASPANFPIAACNMRKSSSTADLLSTNKTFSTSRDSGIRNAAVNDVLQLLPTMMKGILEENQKSMNKMRSEIRELQKFKSEANTKFEAYAK